MTCPCFRQLRQRIQTYESCRQRRHVETLYQYDNHSFRDESLSERVSVVCLEKELMEAIGETTTGDNMSVVPCPSASSNGESWIRADMICVIESMGEYFSDKGQSTRSTMAELKINQTRQYLRHLARYFKPQESSENGKHW